MSGPKFETTIRNPTAGAPREPRVSLVFYFRDGAKIVVPQAQPIVVGRTWPADIVVDEPNVSRTHAKFFLAPDGAVIFEDLGSTNGTYLNGVRVPSGRIGPGDEVRVGDVTVALHTLAVGATVQGLLGYDAFVRLLEDELVRARTFARPASLLMIGTRPPTTRPLRLWAPALLEKLRPVDRAAVYAEGAVLVALPEARAHDAEALGASLVGGDPALRFGVASFPEHGTTVDELLDGARNAMMRGGVAPPPPSAGGGIFVGERMREVWEMVDRVAASTLPVLVLGETGSGKEVIARALHTKSPRHAGPLKTVNCAAIAQNLLESLLFGHEKGAFTGADRQTKGLFEQAHGGTLMLDEIGELPAGAQAALLRVLETKQLVRIGGDREIAVDVRVVAATHRDLERMCEAGAFRTDLYYRLHGVTLHVPPLRERIDEIRPLSDAFLREACRVNGRVLRGIDENAHEALRRWRWPGNVRELRNVVERAVVVARGDIVTVADLPERMREASAPKPPPAHPSGAFARPEVPGAHGHAPPAPAPAAPRPPSAPPPAPPPEPHRFEAQPPDPRAFHDPVRGATPAFAQGYPSPYAPPAPGPQPNDPGAAGPGAATDVDPSLDYKERLRVEMQRYERQLIVDALTRSNGNVSAAAQALKIPVRTLTHKMQALGIKKRFDG